MKEKYRKILRKEKRLWHRHFIPSLAAAAAVALLSLLYKVTVSNVILFASVGASAIILTNTRSHHLTKLRTTIMAYLIAIVISVGVYGLNLLFPLHISINLFLLMLLVGIAIFLADVFHPPVITASLSFILLDRPVLDLLYLFVAIILMFILIRLATYTFSQHLTVKRFWREFRKGS